MSATAVAARAIEAMPQFALETSECKPMVFGMRNAPQWTSGNHAGPAWVSLRCLWKLTCPLGIGGRPMRVSILLQITANHGTPGSAKEVPRSRR